MQRALGSPAVVAIGGHSPQLLVTGTDCRMVGDDRWCVYTSRSLLALEERLVEQLVRRWCSSSRCTVMPVAIPTPIAF